jgi:hypothetical protein
MWCGGVDAGGVGYSRSVFVTKRWVIVQSVYTEVRDAVVETVLQSVWCR